LLRFELGRGHDGPARIGIIRTESDQVTTPVLLSTSAKSVHGIMRCYVPGRDVVTTSDLSLAVIPSLMSDSPTTATEVRDSDLVLLPSMPAVTSLGTDAKKAVLRAQTRLLGNPGEGLPGQRSILRIPPGMTAEDLAPLLRTAGDAGVRAAAVTLRGDFGPDDYQSLETRTLLPRHWFAIVLGRLEPAVIPLLYYLGFDAFDISCAGAAAAQNTRQWQMDSESLDKSSAGPRFCPCAACHERDLASLAGRDLASALQQHNELVYTTVLSEAIGARSSGKLRWLVESRTHHSPAAAAILRRIDRGMYPFLEEFTPTTGAGTMPLIGPESYGAPAVRRFREIVESRYIPSPNKKLILLLPCSAKKPYSESKSHHLFKDVTESALGAAQSLVDEAILTSPLGLVPRCLERVYPAAYYDIPVTGDWDAEETEIGSRALAAHLRKFSSDAVVIAHVTGGYAEIVRQTEEQSTQTIIYTPQGDSVTSRDSLDSLHETLVEMRDLLGLKPSRWNENEEAMRAVADFQFGTGAGSALIPAGSRLNGKIYRTITCRLGGEQLFAFMADSGSVSLTLHGGRLLWPLHRYFVRFDGKELTGGSLFAVGVHEADPAIRPGDEVVVVNVDDEVVAVGKSEMSGLEMCEAENGRAVSLRHKVG